MGLRDTMLGQPLGEVLKSLARVGKYFVLGATARQQETGIELGFGDINAEDW
jgi:hypothetical protein